MTENENLPLALIIEDDSKLATIFSQAVKMSGFETRVIQDGQMAMSTLDFSTPALIVLDLHLPNVPGEVILHKIRSTETLKFTRVILATADPQSAEMQQDKADFILLKPVSFSQLQDLAKRLRSEWIS